MRRAAWASVVLLLGVGFVGGYLVRGRVTKATTTTVVQIQTTAPSPPATRSLEVEVDGPNGGCTETSNLTDSFALRRPGNGSTEGDVIAVAERHAVAACDLLVWFKISPNLGFFVVSDEGGGDNLPTQWGPFDSHQLSAHHWLLVLKE